MYFGRRIHGVSGATCTRPAELGQRGNGEGKRPDSTDTPRSSGFGCSRAWVYDGFAAARTGKPSRGEKRLTEYEREMAGSADAASVFLGRSVGDGCGWQLCGVVAEFCPAFGAGQHARCGRDPASPNWAGLDR